MSFFPNVTLLGTLQTWGGIAQSPLLPVIWVLEYWTEAEHKAEGSGRGHHMSGRRSVSLGLLSFCYEIPKSVLPLVLRLVRKDHL